jgi:hypothetical protein
MKASADDAPPSEERDQGWDKTVLVWNATVARIPAPAVQPDAAQDITSVEDGGCSAESPRER